MIFSLSLLLLLAGVVAWSYRRAFLKAIRQRNDAEAKACKALDTARENGQRATYWQDACRQSYGAIDPALAKLSDKQVARLYYGLRHGFPDEVPFDLPLGTSANPVLSPVGHPARFSYVADLLGGKP